MNAKVAATLAVAAVLGAANGPTLAATTAGEAVRHPIRTMKEKLHMQRSDRGDRMDRTGTRSQQEMPTYGSSSEANMSSDRYGADRERTRERAMQWVQQRQSGSGSGSRSGGMSR